MKRKGTLAGTKGRYGVRRTCSVVRNCRPLAPALAGGLLVFGCFPRQAIKPAHAPDPTRFQQQVLVQGTLDEPTEMAVTSNGRVFFTERKGALKVYEPETGEARLIGELDVFQENENGLIGLALDPSFDRTGWLYLNRTVGDTLDLKHRVSRFTFTGDGITGEKVLLEVPITRGCCHTGGSMTFDGRGNLLVSYGDNTNPFATRYAPIDGRPGRELWDAQRSSANTQDLRGKILRIRPQPDGTYSIPEGNLFSDPREGRPEIYTMGHRNPYRISYDRRTGHLYWGEVGPDARIDSIFGPRGYDELNQARAAGNFGWPLFLADNKPYRERDFDTGWTGEYFDPDRPINDSPNNTGARVLPPAEPALIWYPQGRSEEFPLVGEGGRTAMAGPVYYFDDFPGSDVRLPRHYDGKLIIYEWMRHWMRAVTMDEQGNYAAMEPFLSQLEFDHPIDVELGPDGSLYVLEYGSFWFTDNPNARLSRIVYHAGNRPPVARLTATPEVGAVPLTVELSARESFDHDADPLQYTWIVGGRAIAEGPAAMHTFTEPGTHAVLLVVTDASGATADSTVQIRVGNDPPEVRIALDGNRSFFWTAEPVQYWVEVTDTEDGTLGRGIDPQRVRTTLRYLPEGLAAPVGQAHEEKATPEGLALMQGSDCMACHGVDQASVGPSFRAVAERYAGRDTVEFLVRKVLEGGSGNWGDRVMPAHSSLRSDVAREMIDYILSLASAGAVLPARGVLRLDRHEPDETGAYVLTAAYVDQVRNGIGPLRGFAEVALRAPLIRVGDLAASRFVGIRGDTAAGGADRRIARVYSDTASVYLGRIDLTGVAQLRLGRHSFGQEPTVELRSGGPDGALVASRRVPARAGNAWFDAVVPVKAVGFHDLYVVFHMTGAKPVPTERVFWVDEIRFERGENP